MPRLSIPFRDVAARATRIASAPRVGGAPATSLVETVLRGGAPAVLEAYFFRCGCSPDFYLIHDLSEFHAIAGRFRGDNPELHLYPSEFLVEKERFERGAPGARATKLLAWLEQLSSPWVICRRPGLSPSYHPINTDENIADFASLDWTGWEIAGCDLAEGAVPVLLLPQNP